MSWLDTLEQIRNRDFSKAKPAERETAARDVVNMSSYAVAVVAISPLPFSDAVLMLPIQSAMVLTVGHIYGRRVDRAEAKDLVIELGTLAGASFLARQGLKVLLPVFGGLLTVPAAFAANWAIGRVAMEYFRNPDVSKAALKELYKEAVREGKEKFSRAEFDRFRKRNEEAVKETIAEEEPAPKKRPAKKTASRGAAPKKKPAGKTKPKGSTARRP